MAAEARDVGGPRDLPKDLQAALDRAWPGCVEAQRRCLLGPASRFGLQRVWPGWTWLWRPTCHWWRPGAKAHREIFEAHFRAPCSDVLQSLPTLLFDPGQPFFETPWTRADVVLRSAAPEAFSDAEFWAITMQLFGGDVEAAAAQARQWASDLARRGIAGRGHRRDVWWSGQVGLLEASATGTYL
ncbi:hypothetical protein [Methylibium rhizosphaerae]|uniref:hypothetical protein n=1 Tax=Methylibium rhizosphaerae TaxID=2570323 RepID=UPI00112A1504|nr:hypothetical protein [Methylibium rhizosphaerae]